MPRYDVPDPSKLQEATKLLRDREPWIATVLNTYLSPVKHNAVICCVPIGDAVELLFARDFAGPRARIYGVDIEQHVKVAGINDFNSMSIVASDSTFLRGDIRNLNSFIYQMTHDPDIVISRHPQIIEELDIATGRVLKQNDWWIDQLAALAQRVKKNRKGQMLVTCYLELERDLVAGAMRKIGLNPNIYENNYSPSEYWAYAGPYTRKTDGFVVTV